METEILFQYLDKLITKSVYPVCFAGDSKCILNRWLVKGEEIYQESDITIEPELIPGGELIVQDEMSFVSQNMLESNWRYYISDLKDYAYTYNAPQTLFSQQKDKYIYCVSGVYCTREQELFVYCGMTSPSPIKIWINGRLVFINHDRYAVKKAYFKFSFHEGKNIILVERTVKSGSASRDPDEFCIKLKPSKQMLEYAQEAVFFNRGFLEDIENSYQIVPQKLIFNVEEDIGVMILPKCFTKNCDEKIKVSLINSENQEIMSVIGTTSQNIIMKLDAQTSGVLNIKTVGLETGKKSSTMVFAGDYNAECQKLIKRAAAREDCSHEMMNIMRETMEIYHEPDFAGLYPWRSLCSYKFLKYLEFEKYLRRTKTNCMMSEFDVFKSGVLKIKSRCSSINYRIYLPRDYMPDKEYALVIYMLGINDSSKHLDCPDFVVNRGFKHVVIACIWGFENSLYDYTDNLNILAVVSEVTSIFKIDREKVYLIGAQDGAAKCISLSMRIPHLFAAVVTFNGVDGIETGKHGTFICRNAGNTAFYQVCNIDHYAVNGARALEMFENIEKNKRWVLQGLAEDEIFDLFNSEELIMELLKENRTRYPKKIEYNTFEPIYNRSFWVEIECVDELNYMAAIKAEISSKHQIDITASNIRHFSLLIDREAMGLESEIDVIVNNTKVSFIIREYSEIEFHINGESMKWEVSKLSKPDFDRKYNDIDVKEEQMGIKRMFIDNYLIIKPYSNKHNKKMLVRSLINILQNPLNRISKNLLCGTILESDISEEVLSSNNFVYVIDCSEVNHIFQKKWKNTELEFDGESIRFRDNKFWGEYFALIMCENPYNADRDMLMCIYNSENAAQELEGFLKTFNNISLFYSQAIINTNGYYYSYR